MTRQQSPSGVGGDGAAVLPARRAARRGWVASLAGSKLAYLFLLPSFLFILVFSYYPAFSAVYHSFTTWDGVTPATWAGGDNFHRIFADPEWSIAVANILKLTVFWMMLAITVPLAVARLILGVRNSRLQFAYRLCFILPFVVPQVVVILLWQFIYAGSGVLNEALTLSHHASWQQDWLGNPTTALYAIMAMGFPYVDGFGLLIYTAGLQAIPIEMKEAAAVDGATSLRTFLTIEVPQIVGQLRLMWVLAIINGLQNFTQVLILTQGGPGYTTMVPGLMMYQDAMSNQDFGRASAIGTLLFVAILALTIINLRLGRERGART